MATKPAPQNVPATLHAVLADTYILAIKTHAAHWNVTGPSFNSLHAAFELQYNQLLVAADVIAERLRALGKPAPTGAKDLLGNARISDAIPGTDGVLLARTLGADHRTVARACSVAAQEANNANDNATADLLVKQIEDHEKIAWMLEATAG